jgi:recombination protein RecR
MQLSSPLLQKAVEEFAKLPGIGNKTALRLALHLLKQPSLQVTSFVEAIDQMRQNIQYCQRCFQIADTPICNICSNTQRNQQIICVVENIRDVIAIENTAQFNGTYHVLGGVISPLDGIGPDELHIAALLERIKQEQVQELIFALSPTIQGDTTIFYIQKQLELPVKITTIARGIAFGGELEYADEITLARSISNRQPVEQYVKNGF